MVCIIIPTETEGQREAYHGLLFATSDWAVMSHMRTCPTLLTLHMCYTHFSLPRFSICKNKVYSWHCAGLLIEEHVCRLS